MADRLKTPTPAAAPASTAAPLAAVSTSRPVYDDKHTLTRYGMEQIINGGGSVEYKNRIISNIAHLPSEADLARASGDKGEVERVRAEKEAEIARLRAELDTLKRPVTRNPETAPPAGANPPDDQGDKK